MPFERQGKTLVQSIARQIMDVHPTGFGTVDRKKLDAALLLSQQASQAATACADACLNEGMIKEMRECVRTCLDCADVVDATVRCLSRHAGWAESAVPAILTAAVAALRVCAHESAQHASMHMHARLTAETCRKAETACSDLLNSLAK
ncbi:MAG TPA: four-helix bundle copper-binding protein [Sporichthyaceae bacterium]|nr:four-helix bundle copper-binding protein [Sporichthyaceae bacterium]